jgi:hypothetical protein
MEEKDVDDCLSDPSSDLRGARLAPVGQVPWLARVLEVVTSVGDVAR